MFRDEGFRAYGLGFRIVALKMYISSFKCEFFRARANSCQGLQALDDMMTRYKRSFIFWIS